MPEQLISIGLIIMVVGFVILLAGVFSQAKSKTKVEGGGVDFIDPFPIFVGATSKEMFYFILAISAVIIITFLVLGRKL